MLATAFIASTISIHPDMADHWVWSLNFSMGYLEHPPMVAWVMAIFDQILGFSSPTNMKMAAVLVWTATLTFSYWFAVVATSREIALVFLILLLGSPYFLGMGLMLHINNLMYLFSSMSLVTIAYFIRTKNQYLLLLVAVFLGLTALSKLLAVFLCLSLYLWLMLDIRQRYVWRSWQVYAVPLVVLLVMSPFIYWNIERDWLNIAYQIKRGYNLNPELNISQVLRFVFGQMLFGFIAAPLLLFSFLNIKKIINWAKISSIQYLLIIQFLIPLAFFGYAATRGGHEEIQWVGISYFSGLLLLAINFKNINMALSNLITSLLFFSLVVFHFWWQLFNPLLPADIINRKTDPAMDWIGWQDTADKLIQAHKQKNISLPDVLVSQDYTTAAAISIYMPSKPLTFSIRKPHRNIWLQQEELKDKKYSLVCNFRSEDCANNIKSAQKLLNKTFYPLAQIETYHLNSYSTIRELKIFTSEPVN